MEQSYRFFRNDKCKYFPCHEVKDDSEFNCLLCFCPLYFLEECGGNPSFKNNVKDCSKCKLPHSSGGYDLIMKRLGEEFKRRKDNA